MVNGKLDEEKFNKTIKTAVRFLDNVIDINFYAIKKAKDSNFKHRPIGLGMMGFQDCLYLMNTSYSSQQAVDFADKSAELLSYFAIEASAELAKERGAYSTYQGSLWSQGVLPIDSWQEFVAYRGKYIEDNSTHSLDWDGLRKKSSQ